MECGQSCWNLCGQSEGSFNGASYIITCLFIRTQVKLRQKIIPEQVSHVMLPTPQRVLRTWVKIISNSPSTGCCFPVWLWFGIWRWPSRTWCLHFGDASSSDGGIECAPYPPPAALHFQERLASLSRTDGPTVRGRSQTLELHLTLCFWLNANINYKANNLLDFSRNNLQHGRAERDKWFETWCQTETSSASFSSERHVKCLMSVAQ